MGLFPRPLVIITPFTSSISGGYIEGNHDVSRVSKARALEDETFALKVGARLVRLGLPEATLSSKTGENFVPLVAAASLLCGWPRPRSRIERGLFLFGSRTPNGVSSPLLRKLARLDPTSMFLRKQMSAILKTSPGAVVVSPIGIGNHPNHIALAWASRILRHRISRLYFYEDLPYAARCSRSQIERHCALFDRSLRPVAVNIERVIESKVTNLSIYRSQVGPPEVEKVVAFARRLSSGRSYHERLWTYPG